MVTVRQHHGAEIEDRRRHRNGTMGLAAECDLSRRADLGELGEAAPGDGEQRADLEVDRLAILLLEDGLLMGEEAGDLGEAHQTPESPANRRGHGVAVKSRSGMTEGEQLGEVVCRLVACHGVTQGSRRCRRLVARHRIRGGGEQRREGFQHG